MSKRIVAALLTTVMLLGGCAARPTVTEEKKPEVAPVPEAPAVPPDASRLMPPLSILTTTPDYDPKRYEAALYVKKAMESLGVTLELKSVDNKVITDTSRLEPWDYDALFLQWSNGPERVDPNFYMYTFHSGEIKNAGMNRQGYVNAELDRLAELQKTTLDPEKRRDAVMKAQEILARDAAFFPTYYNDTDQVYNSKRLEGLVGHSGIGLINWEAMTKASIKTGENILRVANNKDVDLLNPLSVVQVTDVRVLDMIYDPLMRMDKDNRPVGAVAESWRFLDDTTIEFKIRPGQKFHDGQPLTAHDVAFTYTWGKANGAGRHDAYVKAIDSVEVKDDLTVTFKLTKADSAVLTTGFVTVPILPKHIWEKQPDHLKWDNVNPIGSGPFKLTYWRRGQEIRMDAVKEHYTKPKVDAIIWSAYTSPDALLGAMELGTADMMNPGLTPEQMLVLKKMDGMEIVHNIGVGYTYMIVNQRRAPWKDTAFRQAMAYAIDWADLVETVTQGTARLAGPGLTISPASTYWYNPDAPKYTFDVNKARQVLKDAGYEWDKDGRLYYPAK